MNVAVIGTGYVGLVSGVCLAEKGCNVVCVDIDPKKIESINQGQSPIYEKGLERLLRKNIGQSFIASQDLHKAVQGSDVTIIAVGTPFDGEEIDLGDIKKAAGQIGNALKHKNKYHVIVVKSTVVPGTSEDVVLPVLEASSEKKAGVDFGVGMNPEFLREGEAVEDFMFPDRIVLGGIDEKTIIAMSSLYHTFKNVDILKTNCRTAEMIKYTSNSLLATMISFSNEIGNLCSAVGNVDVVDVMRGVHLDKRISPILPDGSRVVPAFTSYIEAGCGFGGSCFPKDVKAFIAFGAKKKNPMRLLESVIEINNNQPAKIMEILCRHIKDLKGTWISVLGLAFKPGTDDIRESPSINVVRELIKQGAYIKAYDPVAIDEAMKVVDKGSITFCKTLQEALTDVEAVLIMTRWDIFSSIPDIITQFEKQPLIVDARRMLDKESIDNYTGIGL